MEQSFGWKKDKYDPKDLLHKRRLVALPDRTSLAQFLTPVRDQGNCGSCVGHGIGINLNSVKQVLGIYTEWCSPTYIYNGARFIEGTLPIDNGCYPKDALDWTLQHGILLEHFWPYTGFDRTAPSTEKISEADKYKGFAYYRCVDGVDGICDALSSGHFVSIGSPWFYEWGTTDACGRLAKPTNNSIEAGGHETCFYGYDRIEGVFYGVNSWGTDWGDKGLYIMPFEAIDIFKQRGGYDAHYVTFTKDIDDTPPEPIPSPCIWGNTTANILNKIQILRGRMGRFYYLNPPQHPIPVAY
jgi:hypothetical protein